MNTSNLIVAVVVGISLVGVALATFLPRSYSVERQIHIDAAPNKVFEVVSLLSSRPTWSAWYEREPNAPTEFEGTPGGIGSTMRWVGKDIGSGQVTVTAVEPNRSVVTHLQLIAPMAMESQDTIELEPDATGTRVTWRNQGNLSGVKRFFGLLMDKIMGEDYDRGLTNLKHLIEQKS